MRTKIDMEQMQTKVKRFFMNHECEYVTRRKLADYCNVSLKTIEKVVGKLRNEMTDGTIESKQGAGMMYVPVKPEPEPEAKKGKNAEGYPDPTASKAIEKADAANRLFLSGDVYEGTTSSGYTELLLIVKSWKDTSLVVKLVDPKLIHGDTEYVHGITYMGNTYAADVRRLTNKPNKYITNRMFTISYDTFGEMLDSIGEIFGFETEEQPVIIDNADEVAELKRQLEEKDALLAEAERMLGELAEAREQVNDIDRQLLVQKVEIYEKLLFGDGSRLTIER